MLPAPTTPTVLVLISPAFITFTVPFEIAILPTETVKIYLGSDHAGVKLRKKLVERLRRQGHEPIDFGPDSEAPVDYPDWAARVGRAVRSEAGALGVLVCGSGIGVTMAANKLRGVRAVAAWSPEAARLSRAHNDANVVCLGARLVAEAEAEAILDVWLATPFEGGRHATRVGKMMALEMDEAREALHARERKRLEGREVVRRIWASDPRGFTEDTVHDKSIRNRLGWLRSPEEMSDPARLAALTAFAEEIVRAGFKHAVLLGMGGSSLCPEVLAHTFGAGRGLSLEVLDSTDPASVAAVEGAVDLDRTLFLVSSKSGGTIEVRSFERYFWAKVLARHGGSVEKAGSQFVAITDPGTQLEQLATGNKYRTIFRNPPDIGGRYSALSYFGLVPAALLGIDVAALVGRARAMAAASHAPTLADNPAADLGARLGALAKVGRDKLTLVFSPELASFGSWIEQLVAESTGKLGKGIVPVDGEPLGPPSAYGPDRVFVVSQLAGGAPAAPLELLQALRAAGHPVIELPLADRLDLGAEFFRWELATAVAGAALDINPFDEPNVTEAKQATAKLLEAHARDHRLPDSTAPARPDDAAALRAHLAKVGAGDYLCLSAFFRRTDARHELLTRIRAACQSRGITTTLGYGPRFLHSTGQLHKGGPNNGVFLQLVTEATADLPVPGDTFSFGVLRDAQALGDFQVLELHGRRALRVALGTDVEGNLARLLAALAPAAGSP
jgi:transaldolase/glucose-6-phosphate isomerase